MLAMSKCFDTVCALQNRPRYGDGQQLQVSPTDTCRHNVSSALGSQQSVISIWNTVMDVLSI